MKRIVDQLLSVRPLINLSSVVKQELWPRAKKAVDSCQLLIDNLQANGKAAPKALKQRLADLVAQVRPISLLNFHQLPYHSPI